MSIAETLCTACGLCCDGTLFEVVITKHEEHEKNGRIGLRLWNFADGRVGFKQPCSAFNGKCGVYADRPGQCSAFKCELLTKVEAGTVPLPRAMEIVAATKTHAAGLAAALGPNESEDPLPLKVRAWAQHQKEELPQESLQDLLMLTMLTAQHF